jgi:hypothetical protein
LDVDGVPDRCAVVPAETISFEERLFGPLVAGRECGDCTACCFEITIEEPEIAKPPRQACVHCRADGCAIHAIRPAICRSWFCAWRRIADLPDHLRPDRSGMMACMVENPAAQSPLERLYIIVQWLDGAPIAKSAEADELLARLRRYALPVWVGSDDRMSLHFPRQEIALHLMRGTVPAGDMTREVDAWRRRLPPGPQP